MKRTVLWQRLEGALIFIAGIGHFLQESSEPTWWITVLVFFAPDLTFAGYFLGPKVGAFTYNFAHVYALGFLLLFAGSALELPVLVSIGSLWLAHSGFDRMLGYGLKSPEGFTITHLGHIGRSPKE